jgi:hypothetical protein
VEWNRRTPFTSDLWRSIEPIHAAVCLLAGP